MCSHFSRFSRSSGNPVCQIIFENKSFHVIWLFVKFILVSFFLLKVSMAQFWPRFFLTWFEAHSVLLSWLIML